MKQISSLSVCLSVRVRVRVCLKVGSRKNALAEYAALHRGCWFHISFFGTLAHKYNKYGISH